MIKLSLLGVPITIPIEKYIYSLLCYKIAMVQNNAEIKDRFSTASIINATRVVFNIGGNNYRLICIIKFDKQIIFIRFIGTHKEYDKINAAEV